MGWMVDDPVGGGHDEVAQKAVASSSLLSSRLCRDCVETDIGFRRNSVGSSRRENDMEDEKCSVLTKWFCTGLVQIGQCLLRYDRRCVHFKYSRLYSTRKRQVETGLVLCIQYTDCICIYCVQYAYNLYILRTPCTMTELSPSGILQGAGSYNHAPFRAYSNQTMQADARRKCRCPCPCRVHDHFSRRLRCIRQRRPLAVRAVQSAPSRPKFRTRSPTGECPRRVSNRSRAQRRNLSRRRQATVEFSPPPQSAGRTASQGFAITGNDWQWQAMAGMARGWQKSWLNPVHACPLAPGPRMASTAAQPPRHLPPWE